jgi:predicted DNA-binding transcriptional regulator YafY
VKRWVLGYGAEAKVLRPEEFRDEMAETIRIMLGVYQDDLNAGY